jgi:hypothetical protein
MTPARRNLRKTNHGGRRKKEEEPRMTRITRMKREEERQR